MEEVELELDSWLEWIGYDGQTHLGRLVEIMGAEAQNPLKVHTPGHGLNTLSLNQVIRVFPKVKLCFNPSER